MVTIKRSKTRKLRYAPLRIAFGEMVLKKGCELYHVSDDPFVENPRKPMLFCTFHPSEYCFGHRYVSRIILQKDVSLLFMVDSLNRNRIFHALGTLISRPGNNMAKMHDVHLTCFAEKLRSEGFDGWFSSIDGRCTVEVALLNDSSIYNVASTERIKRLPNFIQVNDGENGPSYRKNWGDVYRICKEPIFLNIHERFKEQLIAYYEFAHTASFPENTNIPFEYAFQVLLSTAKVRFHKGPVNFRPWAC